MRWAMLDTPVGPVSVAVTDDAADGRVCAVRLGPVDRAEPVTGARGTGARATGVLAEAVDQLRAYFAGARTGFDLPLAMPDRAGFERAVWEELCRIPFGHTRTYGQVAAAVGDPGAARAVGTACNRNPLPVIVPCHRVVGAGGKLVGFGGGLPRKVWLLEHEARIQLQLAWS